ncbi:MAG: efflux RND transporter periplasmic adaptor subunit [Candidatus Brocadiia bacterium]
MTRGILKFLAGVAKWVFFLIILAAVFWGGYTFRGSVNSSETPSAVLPTDQTGHEGETIWTCAMHPQIRQNKPGRCPICGMELIQLRASSGKELPLRQVQLTDSDIMAARVETTAVEQRFVPIEVKLFGKVSFDETRVAKISAWIPGRIDRLFVDYTGITVHKGDHLVSIYSPDLLAAQAELLSAKKSLAELEKSDVQIIRETAVTMIEAARTKLRRWGLSDEQVKQIEDSGVTTDHLTIFSPITGIVIDKMAFEGAYVETGMPIYTVADMSVVWAKLDAYESDLGWLRYGQQVEFTADAYPGETFSGRISFIAPVLDPETRTVKVRVNVSNADGRLKPDMFVRAMVMSRVSESGKVMDPSLAGKWISPMHPEVIKDGPGFCDICGMPLVSAESLGYVSADAIGEVPPLVIPVSAALITGKRAVVYVEVGGKHGLYEGREVILGPRAGDFFIVLSGLVKGEMVVTRGNFEIDSVLQLNAKPSMMNVPPDSTPTPAPTATNKRIAAPAEFLAALDGVLAEYFALTEAFASDDFAGAGTAAGNLSAALSKVSMDGLDGTAMPKWMSAADQLAKLTAAVSSAKEIEEARGNLALLSDVLAPVIGSFGGGGKYAVYRMHCPMAFNNRGADWLAKDLTVRNPYFGAAMLSCGDKVEDLFVPVR